MKARPTARPNLLGVWKKVRRLIPDTIGDKAAIGTEFGRLIAKAMAGPAPEPVPGPLNPTVLQRRLASAGPLLHCESARFALIDHGDRITLFVDGTAHPLLALSAGAALLCDRRYYAHAELQPALRDSAFLALLTRLYNSGYVRFPDAGPR